MRTHTNTRVLNIIHLIYYIMYNSLSRRIRNNILCARTRVAQFLSCVCVYVCVQRVVQRRRRRRRWLREQRRSHALDTRLGPGVSSAHVPRVPVDAVVAAGKRTAAAVPRKPGADPVRVNTKRERPLVLYTTATSPIRFYIINYYNIMSISIFKYVRVLDDTTTLFYNKKIWAYNIEIVVSKDEIARVSRHEKHRDRIFSAAVLVRYRRATRPRPGVDYVQALTARATGCCYTVPSSVFNRAGCSKPVVLRKGGCTARHPRANVSWRWLPDDDGDNN